MKEVIHMLEKLKAELIELKSTPPWRRRINGRKSELWEGVGAPEPGDFRAWKNQIRKLQRTIRKEAEEDARQKIDRP